MIYLDNAATTRITEPVLEAMMPYLTTEYGNPSTKYKLGRDAHKAVEHAREQVAKAINAEPKQIIFTSGATESNNLILNYLDKVFDDGTEIKHGFCDMTEHPSVFNSKSCYHVDMTDDNEVVKALKRLKFISCMMVNNETGDINKVETWVERAHEWGVLIHTDATQAFGHIPIDVKKLGVDFLSMSGHKFHAPKGVGILYIKDPKLIPSLSYGGHQEFGIRAGTENVVGIVGLGKAAELYNYNEDVDDKQCQLRKTLVDELSEIPDMIINTDKYYSIPSILNVAFKGIESESLMLFLDNDGICVSAGSACNSREIVPSRVLKAIGVPDDYILGAVRISMSDETTEEEIRTAADAIKKNVKMLREM